MRVEEKSAKCVLPVTVKKALKKASWQKIQPEDVGTELSKQA